MIRRVLRACLRCQFFRRDLIVGVQLSGTYRQSCRQVFLYVKGVLFVKIRKIFVIRVFGNVILPGQEGTHAPDLQEAFSAVHHRKLVNGHQIFATMSSDEFKNGQKNSPSPGRRRTIMLLFSCHLDFSHKIISNPDFLFLFPINFWDFTSQNMAN